MSDRQHLRDLTRSTDENARQWKVVGLELAHRWTFCGDAADAVVGCPDYAAANSLAGGRLQFVHRRYDHDAVCGGEASANGPAGARYERGRRRDRQASQPCPMERKRYEKGTALVAAYSPRLKRIGIQNWRRASTVAGMSRQAFDAQRGVAKGIAGRPASSTQWNRIGRSR